MPQDMSPHQCDIPAWSQLSGAPRLCCYQRGTVGCEVPQSSVGAEFHFYPG